MYFKEFPTIPYDAEGNGKFKDVKKLLNPEIRSPNNKKSKSTDDKLINDVVKGG